MNSHILSKLTIFAAAFVINGLMFAGVNYLFNSQMHQRSDWVSLAQASRTTRGLGARSGRREQDIRTSEYFDRRQIARIPVSDGNLDVARLVGRHQGSG